MPYFADIPQVRYEGAKSDNPLAFKYYNPEEIVDGISAAEYLRFSAAFWHTLTLEGRDPFGEPVLVRPWDRFSGMDRAKARVEAAFELFDKLGIRYFAFHDWDIAPHGDSLKEWFRNLDEITEMLKSHMRQSGVKLLWNTANLFSHPRYVHGAATSNSAYAFACAAAQVKKGLEIGKELGAENFVFWGGREGYDTLLNTHLELELDNQARFYHMALEYADEIGFSGQFLVEPKPKEPVKHQYHADVMTTIAFLQKYGLKDRMKLNIEANHATLAGHTFEHELRMARIHGMLGSVDANQGDLLLGWDTDEFSTDLYVTTLAMYEIERNGGLGSGGLNFDAKVRRGSLDLEDLIQGHIAGMDSFALGWKAARKLRERGVLEQYVEDRYRSYREGIGREILEGRANFHQLSAYALESEPPEPDSGRQEWLRREVNRCIVETAAELHQR